MRLRHTPGVVRYGGSKAMNESDIPHALAMKYAQFIDHRQFQRMAEIMAPDFRQHGPGFEANSLQAFVRRRLTPDGPSFVNWQEYVKTCL